MAIKKKLKLTPLEQQWQKELKRLQRFIKQAQKRGYSFPENIIPEKPKRVTTKSVQRLQKLKPDTLYKKATYTLPTGKTVSGPEGRKTERRKAAQKAARTRKARDRYYKGRSDKGTGKPPKAATAYIENIREEIQKWTPEVNWTPWFAEQKTHDKNILENILEGAIRTEGYNNVAARLEENATEVNSLVQEILYGSGGGDYKSGMTGRNQINFDLTRFSAIVAGRPLTVEESQELTDLAETYEDND